MTVSFEKPGTPEELVEDLIHFGVKGMRWGHRKKEETSGPKKISARKERKAKGHEIEAEKMQVKINKLRTQGARFPGVQKNRERQAGRVEKKRHQELKDAKDIREGHLTDHQKKVLIGAGVAAGVLAAYGTYKLVDSGTARQLLNRNTPFKKNDLLSRQMSHEAIMRDVVKPINPGYGKLGTKMNCRRATYAYEMRRRGFDVKATNTLTGATQTQAGQLNAITPNLNIGTSKFSMTKRLVKEESSSGGVLSDHIRKGGGLGKEKVNLSPQFIGGKGGMELKTPGTAQAIFNHIGGRHPSGARGELSVNWKMGGSHSMAWEKIGDKVHIFDAQTGEHYNLNDFHMNLSHAVKDAGITRLDNIPLNESFLRKWVFNVK